MDSKYTEQAKAFLEKTNTRLDIEYIGHGPYFDDDKESRDIYRFTLTRDGRKYTSKFGQSLAHSGFAFGETNMPSKADILGKRQQPTEYDILACLTKHDVGSFENFCSEFGYDEDSRKAEKTYFTVQKEYSGVCLIWNSKEREQLQEIN